MPILSGFFLNIVVRRTAISIAISTGRSY